jgi:hypothetical protein
VKVSLAQLWCRGKRVKRPRVYKGDLGLSESLPRADLLSEDGRAIINPLYHPRLTIVGANGFYLEGFQERGESVWERQTWYCMPKDANSEGER